MNLPLTLPLGKAEIEAILPHRDPFLLLDEVIELEPNGASSRASSSPRRTAPGTFPATRSCPA